jgi:hypothetical protein
MKSSKPKAKSSRTGTTPATKKGVYKLNPTKSIMKVGTGSYIKSISTGVSGYKQVKKVKGLNK